MPAKPGTLKSVSVYTDTLADLHYLKNRLTEPSFKRKSRKSRRIEITGFPSLMRYIVSSYLRRFKNTIPF